MNAAKKLAKKNIERRQLGAGGVFMQMLEDGKSAKEIGEALGMTEQQVRTLIFRIEQQVSNGNDCSAYVVGVVEESEVQE